MNPNNFQFHRALSLVNACLTSTTESFIEVSEEELNDEEDQTVKIPEMEPPEEVSEAQPEEEKTSEGSLSETTEDDNDEIAASGENEPQEETEGESTAAPAANEWEDFDAVRKTDRCFLKEK